MDPVGVLVLLALILAVVIAVALVAALLTIGHSGVDVVRGLFGSRRWEAPDSDPKGVGSKAKERFTRYFKAPFKAAEDVLDNQPGASSQLPWMPMPKGQSKWERWRAEPLDAAGIRRSTTRSTA